MTTAKREKGKRSLSGHQSAHMKSDAWMTPREWIRLLGPFNTDPACPKKMPWKTASRMISKNGLDAHWSGRVWLNPPFGSQAISWVKRMSEYGNGILLLAARTETKMFFDYIWPKASGILFVKGRPHFCFPNGKPAPFNSGAPIVLIAYGTENALKLQDCKLGEFLRLGGPHEAH